MFNGRDLKTDSVKSLKTTISGFVLAYLLCLQFILQDGSNSSFRNVGKRIQITISNNRNYCIVQGVDFLTKTKTVATLCTKYARSKKISSAIV
jgi:hypothetical protein